MSIGICKIFQFFLRTQDRIFIGVGFLDSFLGDGVGLDAIRSIQGIQLLNRIGVFLHKPSNIGVGRFLVGGRKFGGTQTDGKIYDDILRYNTQDDVWTYAGSTKYPTENSFGFSINHSAYMGGGENGDGILTTLYRIED